MYLHFIYLFSILKWHRYLKSFLMADEDLLIIQNQYLGCLWPTLNSLAPGRFQFNFRYVIFKLTLVNGGSYEIALRWMPLDLTDDKSTLAQVMAWCRHATIHYLSQCWPRSMSSNGVTRPQWVNVRRLSYIGLTRSISWLLMPWLLASPGHQQPWYWLCRTGRSLSYLRKDFN